MAEVARKHGVSDVTIHAWRKRFGQLEAADVKRLRQLQHENARLKKVLAERVMDIETPKKVDACANGQQLQFLTVADEFTRECFAIDVAGGIRSGRPIIELELRRKVPR